MSQPRREGSKGYCRNCGFAIHSQQVSTGRVIRGPFWRLAWVHTNGQSVHCFWTAQPKSHSKPAERTLYQQTSYWRRRALDAERKLAA